MRYPRVITGMVAALTMTHAAATEASGPDRFFHAYDEMIIDLPSAASEARENGTISLLLGGELVTLDVSLHSVRAFDHRSHEVLADGTTEVRDAAPVATYRAWLKPGGEARLLISEQMLSGFVHRGDDWFFVEPMSRFRAGAAKGSVITYRQADIKPDVEALAGLAPRMDKAALMKRGIIGGSKSGPARVLELATEADGEFTQDNGGSVASANMVIEGIVNELDGIYEANLGIQIRLTDQFASVNPATDPWNSTPFGHGPKRFGPYDPSSRNINCTVNNGPGVWEQFRNYWLGNPARQAVRRDEAAFFTTRDMRLCATEDDEEAELFGSAAQVGSVCEFSNRSYLIMEQYPLNSAGLLAHELGHAVGVNGHDSDCDGGAKDWIMCGTVQAQSTMFSTDSRTLIHNHLEDFGACVEPPRTKMVIEHNGDYFFSAPTPPNVGRTETLVITNDSAGTPLVIANAGNMVSGSCFQQTSTPASVLAAGQSTSVNVRLRCSSLGTKTGTLTVQSDDPVRPQYRINLNGQVLNGSPATIGLRASYKPSFSAARTTYSNYTAHDQTQLSYYYDPNQGGFENRPVGVPCSDGSDNQTYFTIRKVGAAIQGCRFQASWDAQEHVCNQAVVDSLNAGDEVIINTDDVLTDPQSCQLKQPLDYHVRYGEEHFMKATLIRNGGEYRRRINFVQNSKVNYQAVSDDTWVDESNPSTTHGGQTTMTLRNLAGFRGYAFLYGSAQAQGMTVRSLRLLLDVGPVAIGSAAVYEIHNPPPPFTPDCHESRLTWDDWETCFPSYSYIETQHNIPANGQLGFDVTSATGPGGGVVLFGIATTDTGPGRTIGSGESATDKPYIVTTASQ